MKLSALLRPSTSSSSSTVIVTGSAYSLHFLNMHGWYTGWYSTSLVFHLFCLKPFVYISQQQHELLVLAADKMFIGPCQTQNLQKEL